MDELFHSDGKVLLVGEGDFSFSVSLIQKLPSNKYTNITASSLETEESINKHQHARSNMEYLMHQGVTVLLSTDATRLHENPNIIQHRYSRVIFNFPHAGGKSNHKKNRKLLNDFFASAAAVLECQGQILVTLCKGQGGTPSDKPLRKWHDSWQVVSMAANASLILVKVLPFIAEAYGTYTSTGFRSLDKGFHTENALTHVFEKVDSIEVPTDGSNVKMIINDIAYWCSRYTYSKLLAIRQISENVYHPVCKVYSMLAAQLETCYKDIPVKDHGQCIMMRTQILDCNIETDTEHLSGKDDSTRVTMDTHNFNDISIEVSPSNSGAQFIYLSRNSFELLKDFADCVSISYGPVFVPCLISCNQSAVEYHMIVSQPFKMKDFKTADSVECLIINEAIKPVVESFKHHILPTLTRLLRHQNYIAGFYDQVSERADFSGVQLVSTMFVKQHVDSEHQHSDNDSGLVEDIGHMYCKVDDTTGPSQCIVYLDINLHKLSCLLYNITDQRLLWSDDHRILEQYRKLETYLNTRSDMKASISADKYEGDPTIRTGSKLDSDTVSIETNEISVSVTPASLYPMTFNHDMSFWENGKTVFCEIDFNDIVRDVAGDVVISVELIDKYTDQESNRTSRCYRLTFQSADKVLSYDISWKLQSLIRLEVEKRMKIVLR